MQTVSYLRNTKFIVTLLLLTAKTSIYYPPQKSSTRDSAKYESLVTVFITYWAKLLNPDWLRQRAFFLNHEGTFGNQEGMIT